jgi:hypothetical protein
MPARAINAKSNEVRQHGGCLPESKHARGTCALPQRASAAFAERRSRAGFDCDTGEVFFHFEIGAFRGNRARL